MNTVAASADVIQQFVTRARRLYTLPAVAMKVLELTSQPAIDAQALAACIEKDPALTTKLLRVVNSPLFGLSHRVSNLKQTLALLGTKPLKLLVLGFSLPSSLASPKSAEVLSRYWRSTLIKALAAREIAEHWFSMQGDEPFIAGLLEDLGILVLIQDLGESYERFLASVWEEGEDLLRQESEVLGFEHRLLTAKLLEHWRLPTQLVAAIAQPYPIDTTAGPTEGSVLTRVLYLADLVTRLLMDRQPAVLERLLHAGQHYCHLTMQQLEALTSTLESQTPQLAEILSLDLPSNVSYSSVLADAHRHLAEEMERATPDLLSAPHRPRDLLIGKLADGGSPATVSELTYGTIAAPRLRESLPPSVGDEYSRGRRGLTETCNLSTREGLLGRISAAVARCRQARSSVSLLLVELDGLENVALLCGLEGIPHIVRKLGLAIRRLADIDSPPAQIDDGRFAVILDEFDRRRGVDLGWSVVDEVRHWSHDETRRMRISLSVSVGLASLAMPPRNFPAEELLIAAERCLSGVQLSGGDGVKSIDIY